LIASKGFVSIGYKKVSELFFGEASNVFFLHHGAKIVIFWKLGDMGANHEGHGEGTMFHYVFYLLLGAALGMEHG
jgi:hypothetical protein